MVAGVALAGFAISAGHAATPKTATPAEATPVIAADAAIDPLQQDGSKDSAPKDIIVSAPIAHSEADVLSGTSVVSGEELTRSLRPTIGETLARQPGVSATSFGPSASRPVLRGFQGDRVRVLTDGIGSIDVSNTSVDHAVIIDPLLAERIEVLRGPAALLYGSSAVGGVVNVIDKRIPRSIPAEGYRLEGIATYGSAATERSFGAAGDVALGSGFVAHVDGTYAKSDDLHIGGFALTPALRAQALATAALPAAPPAPGEDPIDFAGNAAVRNTLPNTAAETWTAGFGLAYIGDRLSLGASYSHYDSLYGVPIRFATLPDQAQESPRLDIVQNRVDVRGEWRAEGDFVDKIRLRVGQATYRHFELAPDGTIGTAFFNNGVEGRLEVIQAKRGDWQGASGVQYFRRDFDVEGDEAFLPANTTDQIGLFTLQQLVVGKIHAEAGVRYERTNQAANPLAGDPRFFGGRRNFDAFSASLGASYEIIPGWRIGLNGSRTERAPSAEELFANGPHAGTQAYELGNPNFRIEGSWGLEATLHGHGDGYSIDASAYYNWFNNFISEAQVDQSVCVAAAAPSGRTVDLPCFRSTQANARYYGFEIDASVKLAQVGDVAINADALADYVHATITSIGPVPRIPAGRVLGALEAQTDQLNGRIEVEHVFQQNRTAAFETPTNGYTVANVSIGFRPFDSSKLSFTLSANNLFDVTARRAASFLKDYAPLAGRDIRISARFSL
ncbi:MAG: TonB-dependent receptor [Sphingomonas sp.]|nr:TonB-dependent receptor [Sphingomonas sp.]